MILALYRTVILYIVAVGAMRFMGKRQIGELQPSELVVAILISELAAIPMQDFAIPVLYGLIPILTLISLEVLISFLSIKSPVIRRLVCGNPCVVIRNGVIDQKKMKDLRLGIEDLIREVRLKNVMSLDEVEHCIVETNGKISIILKPESRPVTVSNLSLVVSDRGISRTIISDGKLDLRNLSEASKDIPWVLQQIRNAGLSDINQVFFMSVDNLDHVFIVPKEGK